MRTKRRVGADGLPQAWRPRLGRAIAVTLGALFYRVRAVGAENMPTEGPVVLVSNHAGFVDGPLLLATTPRPATFLAKSEMYHGFFGWLLSTVGQIPVDRSVGDRTALTTAVGLLRRGQVVGVFPEGTRGVGDVKAVELGAAWLALHTGAMLLPVAISGSAKDSGLPRLWTRLTVTFGVPFELDVPPGPGRTRLQAASAELHARLAAHVAEPVAGADEHVVTAGVRHTGQWEV